MENNIESSKTRIGRQAGSDVIVTKDGYLADATWFEDNDKVIST